MSLSFLPHKKFSSSFETAAKSRTLKELCLSNTPTAAQTPLPVTTTSSIFAIDKHIPYTHLFQNLINLWLIWAIIISRLQVILENLFIIAFKMYFCLTCKDSSLHSLHVLQVLQSTKTPVNVSRIERPHRHQHCLSVYF